VAAFYLFTRGGLALDELELVEESAQAVTALDVRLGRVQLRERRVAQELDARALVSRLFTPRC
jgi:hypothetical protein